MQFHFVYKSLAHPEKDGFVNPVTVAERLLHIKETQRIFKGLSIPWLCDNMENELKHQLGGLNNPEFIFDPDGKLVRLRDWSSPRDLRKDLEALVGTVKSPTNARSLGLRMNRPVQPTAARGVVPPLRVSGAMQAIKSIAHVDTKSPFYAKVRAEVDADLLRNGTGKLYLGIRLDPLLGVCWNNLAKPIEYELTAVAGTSLSPRSGVGPKLVAESDSDPREFLIDIKNWEPDQPIGLQIRYFACNKDEGWCRPVTQNYELQLVEDRDAGTVRGRSNGRMRGGRGRQGRGGRGRSGPPAGRTPR